MTSALAQQELDSELDHLPLLEMAEKNHSFFVEGISCHRCVQRLETIPLSLSDAQDVRIDMSQNLAHVRLSQHGRLSQVARKMRELGFTPHYIPSSLDLEKQKVKSHRLWLLRLGVAGACAGNIMLLSVSVYAGADPAFRWLFDWISFFLFLPALLFSAWPFYVSAIRRWPSVDLPIVAALLAGFGWSTYNVFTGAGEVYFDSLSMLIFLLLSSRYFLMRLQSRYLSLSQLEPFLNSGLVERVRETDGATEKVRPEQLRPDDRLLIHHGQRIPADGFLESSSGNFNTSVLSGEPAPQKFLSGDRLYAGYLNESHAPILLRTEKRPDQSRIGDILKEVERQLTQKTKFTEFTDRVGRWFTVTVLTLATLILFYWLPLDLVTGAERSLALIILACPCALAFAVPLAQSLSLMKAAQMGNLTKNAAALEKLAQATDIFFDKTGTLTSGHFEVLGWENQEPQVDELARFMDLESHSNHPLALSLRRHFQKELTPISGFRDVEQHQKGIRGKLGRDLYEVRGAAESFSESGLITRLEFLRNGHSLGVLRLGDRIRPEAASAIRELQNLGLQIHLVSGDAEAPTQGLGQALHIPPKNVHAQQSPEDKGRRISSLPTAIMVGDGANDALALSMAITSIAVSGGAEVSLKAADVYSSRADLRSIPELILLSRRMVKTMKTTLGVSLSYNLIGGSLALLGLVNPLIAAILMPVSSASVLATALIGTQARRGNR